MQLCLGLLPVDADAFHPIVRRGRSKQWAKQALAGLDLCSHSPKVPQGKTLQRETVVGSVSQLQGNSWAQLW